ncbi:MAG TPA: hypothetical protein VE326_08200 [Candidatus Binatia bacterium]|nr:hypothetical protein [Candidatus Binatia bacterium]
MTRRIPIVLCLLAIAAWTAPAGAQMLDARRLGMGGVATSDNNASRTANVAFRAVPTGQGSRSIPLPIGLIQYASHHPTFDSSDPDFNIFEILNLAANPPLTLSLSKPKEVSGDISVFVARDSLMVDLSDVRRAIPKDPWKQGGVYHLMAVGFGVKNFFVQVVPTIHVRNEFDLDPKLRAALRDAQPFTGNTRYGTTDDGVAQAAVAWQAGMTVRPVYRLPTDANEGDQDDPSADDPRRNGATALYLGAAPKVYWGLAYGSIRASGGATTADTLFGSSDPVSIDMTAVTRDAAIGGDGGSGHGFGADVGGVFFYNNFELGVGVNDMGSTIDWKTTVKQHVYDDATNQFTTTTIGRDVETKSRIPAAVTVNVAKRMGSTNFAADVVDTELKTMVHLGVERWVGMVALRGGAYRDANGRWQGTAGTGLKLGGIGLDLAVATHSRNVEEERAAELCASLTLY